MRTMIRSSVDKVQCVVVGAGVIGLACAKRLSECGFETVVLESANVVGSGEGAFQAITHLKRATMLLLLTVLDK